jgi:hypothetical protein
VTFAQVIHGKAHLLLDLTVTQENTKYWRMDDYAIKDLSTICVRLKNEFNVSKEDLMNQRSTITITKGMSI